MAERMSEAGELRLVCRVGLTLCALPLAHIGETMRPLPVETIQGAPDFVLGVAIIRGTVTPVIACAALLGGDDQTASRFVTIDVADRRVALAVDAVVGVRRVTSELASDMPPLLRDANPDVVSRIEVLDSELLLMLQDALVVPESSWASLEAASR
jgi:purine-binding chemotaxis protein CheW